MSLIAYLLCPIFPTPYSLLLLSTLHSPLSTLHSPFLALHSQFLALRSLLLTLLWLLFHAKSEGPRREGRQDQINLEIYTVQSSVLLVNNGCSNATSPPQTQTSRSIGLCEECHPHLCGTTILPPASVAVFSEAGESIDMFKTVSRPLS